MFEYIDLLLRVVSLHILQFPSIILLMKYNMKQI